MREIKRIKLPDPGISQNKPAPVEKRPLPPFTARDASRNYRAMYRDACDFHERNAQLPANRVEAEVYWGRIYDDLEELGRKYGDDPFFKGLIDTVMDELQREYDAVFPCLLTGLILESAAENPTP